MNVSLNIQTRFVKPRQVLQSGQLAALSLEMWDRERSLALVLALLIVQRVIPVK
jgi:hypothetical protein